MSRSPTDREFWDWRYRNGRTPWDAGAVPAALARFLQTHPGQGASVLIPGCGSGWEIEAFAAAGYAVTAIDFSPAAVARARGRLPLELHDRVHEGDFFTYAFAGAPFDLMYERTFLCALPPDRWPEVAARSAQLVRPGGRVIGLYVFGPKDDGPPFPLDPGEDDRLFSPQFVTTADVAIPAAESLPLFAGAERWKERRRVP